MSKKTEWEATLAVVMAGVLWGLMGSFVKVLSGYGFGSMQIQGIRVGFSAVMYLVFLVLRKPSALRIAWRDLWMFIGTGVISTVLFGVFYFYTGIHSEISVAVILLYTSPVFVMLMSALFFHEKITRVKLIALVMTFVGCVFVAGLIGGHAHVTGLTLLTGLASGFFYALYSIFGKYALEKYETLTVTAYTFFCAAIVLVPLSGAGSVLAVYREQPLSLAWSLCASLFSTVMSYFLYSWGLARMESGRAAILVTTEPLVGAVLGILLFGESHDVLKLLGIVLILAAILLLSRDDSQKSAQDLQHVEKK